MQRSGSQKALLVLSILKIIGAVLLFLVGLLAVLALGTVPEAEMASVAAEAGVSTEEALGAGFAIGAVMIVAGIIDLILGILGVRAANDNQKIMPVWVLALISLIFGIIGAISGIVSGDIDGSQIGSYIVSIIVSILIFWIANNIKREAGR